MTIRFDALCRIAEEVRFDPATEDLSKFFLPPTPSPELPIPLSSDDLDPAGPPFPSSPLPLPPSPFSLENSDTESDSNLGELPFPSSPLPPPPSPFSPEASAAESDSSYSDVPAASGIHIGTPNIRTDARTCPWCERPRMCTGRRPFSSAAVGSPCRRDTHPP